MAIQTGCYLRLTPRVEHPLIPSDYGSARESAHPLTDKRWPLPNKSAPKCGYNLNLDLPEPVGLEAYPEPYRPIFSPESVRQSALSPPVQCRPLVLPRSNDADLLARETLNAPSHASLPNRRQNRQPCFPFRH